MNSFKSTALMLFILFSFFTPQTLHAIVPKEGTIINNLAANFDKEVGIFEPSTTVVLYDGTGLMSFSPGFSLFGLPFFSWQETYSGSATTLSSTSNNNIQVGYNSRNIAVPLLYRDLGYRLTFTSQLNSEAHVSLHRAGFSVITLADDMKGVELGFWPNEIWAQNDGTDGSTLFTHGESVVFDTTAVTTYTLEFIDDVYRLSANNIPILTGPVRDYSAFTGIINPYINQNYIFMGDDTKSAQASLSIATVTVTTDTCSEHNAQAPLLAADIDSQTVDLTWSDTLQNFSYTAVYSSIPYTAVADATTLGSMTEMFISHINVLANAGHVFYQVQEDFCATAVSNEIGVFRFAIQAGN